MIDLSNAFDSISHSPPLEETCALNISYRHVWPQKKPLEDQVKLRIGEVLLPKQDSVEYLKVTVDKQLSWKSHIANV